MSLHDPLDDRNLDEDDIETIKAVLSSIGESDNVPIVAHIYRSPADRHYLRMKAEADRPPVVTPMPSRRQRTVTRWLVFGAHLLPFGLVILLYPALNITDNTPRLLLGVWALLLIAHLIVTALLDLREGVIFARKDRRRRRQMEIQSRRSQMLEKLTSKPE